MAEGEGAVAGEGPGLAGGGDKLEWGLVRGLRLMKGGLGREGWKGGGLAYYGDSHKELDDEEEGHHSQGSMLSECIVVDLFGG